MPGKIDFYFDFWSPYSYLAYQELPKLAARRGYEVVYHPVELNELKLRNNNTGPSSREQPLKSRYNRQEFARWRKRYGVPFERAAAPDPQSRLNKGAFLALDRGRIHDYIVSAWRRTWGAGGSLADEGLMREVARDMGWDAEEYLAFVVSHAARERYRASTDAAHERGVFGVPSMIVGDEMFWGNDHLVFLEEHLAQLAHAPA
jgi:2-hydroxychromene-2-carboxylate isomerase